MAYTIQVKKSAQSYGAAGDGVTDDRDSINDAITAIGSNEEVLIFPAGTYYIGSSLTFPVNLVLEFQKGAVFQDNGDAGVTITIRTREIIAGAENIFNMTGAGSSIVFPNGGPGYANWWCEGGTGASGDPWTSNSGTAGLQDAHDSGLEVIKFSPGYFSFDTQSTLTNDDLWIKGSGRGVTKLLIDGTPTHGIQISGSDIVVSDFTLYGSVEALEYIGYRPNAVTSAINLNSFNNSIIERVKFISVRGSGLRLVKSSESAYRDLELIYCGESTYPALHFDQGTSASGNVVRDSIFSGIYLKNFYNEDGWVAESSGGNNQGSRNNIYDGWNISVDNEVFCDVTVTSGTPQNGDAVTITGGITATMSNFQSDVTYGDVMRITGASAWTFVATNTITGPASAWTATIDRVDKPSGQMVDINDAGAHRFDNFDLDGGLIQTSEYSFLISYSYQNVISNLRLTGTHLGGGLQLDTSGYANITNVNASGAASTQAIRAVNIENSPQVVVSNLHTNNYYGILFSGTLSDFCILQNSTFRDAGDILGEGIVETESTSKGMIVSTCNIEGANTTGEGFRINGNRNQVLGCRVIDSTCAWAFRLLSLDLTVDSCHATNIVGGGIYGDAGDRLAIRNNTLVQLDTDGIRLDTGSDVPVITGNVIFDYDRNDTGTYYGVYADCDTKADGLIFADNYLDNNGNTVAGDVLFAGAYANLIVTNNNFENATNVRAGSGENNKILGNSGALENKLSAAPGTATHTGDTNETDLLSVTLPQYSNDPFETIKIRAAGTKSDGGTPDTKTFKFHFGTQSVTFHPAANDTIDWQFEADIAMRSNTSHRCLWNGKHSSITHGYDVFTDNINSGSVTLKITGQLADAGDSITQDVFIVELL